MKSVFALGCGKDGHSVNQEFIKREINSETVKSEGKLCAEENQADRKRIFLMRGY